MYKRFSFAEVRLYHFVYYYLYRYLIPFSCTHSVSVLKEVIHRSMKVPPEKQVLLISGGEALDPSLRVCQYSAGTDTNPIFLFSKSTIEGQNPPSPSIDYGSDTDLQVR